MALLGFSKPLNGSLLLLEIPFVFDFSFDGLEFVAEFTGKINHGGHRGIAPEKLRGQFSQNRHKILDNDLWPFKQLRKRLADCVSIPWADQGIRRYLTPGDL